MRLVTFITGFSPSNNQPVFAVTFLQGSRAQLAALELLGQDSFQLTGLKLINPSQCLSQFFQLLADRFGNHFRNPTLLPGVQSREFTTQFQWDAIFVGEFLNRRQLLTG